jgi:hypothetical protein
MIMKTLLAIALVIASVAPAAAQTKSSADLTGKWEGTFAIQRPDGTASEPRPIVFNLTQKGKEITGTAGPADQQEKIAKGVVADGKATFEVPLSNGAVFKFALTMVKGRLQGDMSREFNGQVNQAKVDAAKAAPEKK